MKQLSILTLLFFAGLGFAQELCAIEFAPPVDSFDVSSSSTIESVFRAYPACREWFHDYDDDQSYNQARLATFTTLVNQAKAQNFRQVEIKNYALIKQLTEIYYVHFIAAWFLIAPQDSANRFNYLVVESGSEFSYAITLYPIPVVK